MHTTNLRKVGGSVMMAVPPAILDLLNLSAGSSVAVSVESGKLIVDPQARPKYTLAQLLAASDYSAMPSDETRAWTGGVAAGGELI